MARKPLNLDTLPSNNQTIPNLDPVARGVKRQRSQGGMAAKLRDIGNSLFDTIIRPAIEDNTLDFINEASRMLIKRGASATSTARPTPYYKNYQQPRRAVRRVGASAPQQRLVAQPAEVFENIHYPTRQEAEGVLGKMMELALEYGAVSVGALYALSGISQETIHEDWGWFNLQGVRPQPTNDGYYIIGFPEPVYLLR